MQSNDQPKQLSGHGLLCPMFKLIDNVPKPRWILAPTRAVEHSSQVRKTGLASALVCLVQGTPWHEAAHTLRLAASPNTGLSARTPFNQPSGGAHCAHSSLFAIKRGCNPVTSDAGSTRSTNAAVRACLAAESDITLSVSDAGLRCLTVILYRTAAGSHGAPWISTMTSC